MRQIYAPVQYPKVGSFESPLAQHLYRQFLNTRNTVLYNQACTAERAYQSAVKVKFAC